MQETFWFHRGNKRRKLASRYVKLCVSTLYLNSGKHTSLFRKQQITFFLEQRQGRIIVSWLRVPNITQSQLLSLPMRKRPYPHCTWCPNQNEFALQHHMTYKYMVLALGTFTSMHASWPRARQGLVP